MSINSLAAVERGLDELEHALSAIQSEMMAAESHLYGRWSHDGTEKARSASDRAVARAF